MAGSNPPAPIDGNYKPIPSVTYDATGHQYVSPQSGTVSTDSTNSVLYAPTLVQQVAAASVSGTLQSAAAATGAGTALSMLGNSTVIFTVTGTFVGTITWQGTEDGTNWSSVYAVQLGTSTISTTATTTGLYEASVAGLQQVRANITAYTSGAITVTAHAVPGSFSARVFNAILQAGSAVIGNAIIQATSGTALTADQTNSILRSSLYVKTTTAGDTVLTLGQGAMAASLPVTIANNQGAIGSVVAQAVAGTALGADQTNSILKTSLYGKNAAAGDTAFGADSGGALRVSLQGQQTPVTGSAAVSANTSNSAALPAVSSKTNYITGFSVTTQGGSGAAAGAVTITGTITGTLTFEVGAAANNPVQVYYAFPSPVPASATNTAITVNVPTLGANTGAAACTITGYVQ